MALGDLPQQHYLRTIRQLVIVLAEDWYSTVACLQRYARETENTPWQPVGRAVSVTLGKNGLAWGLGIYPAELTEPSKREGDGRAPAGIFALTQVFAEPQTAQTLSGVAKLPCLATTAALKCVDDSKSCHYNQIVSIEQCSVDWVSAEEMLRTDARYTAGVVVAHNPTNLPDAGSCIFVHVHEAPGVPTAGCTAAALPDVLAMCAWLDSAANPYLVQMPAAVYREKAPAWGFPL